ncbi:uncharacterized protein SPSK_07455 [Sporothrix schenckii 1099-18]|uniref:Uncharacterized protein n=1 Tax=Sporothrix schenckii 1099-18 TaxID=1397361 RepID=A0A0F2MEQ7_SPOSC|nr:uncharacterized protein SPSK_07455 [Sporothrix schenckii 1099-18]KJR88112.1 hypothetical protein SPSK_07455 [Sporothrix schenckii 1099-18]
MAFYQDRAEFVEDGHLDVCMRASGERMKSEATGRNKFNESFFTLANDAKGNKAYQVEEDFDLTAVRKLAHPDESMETDTTRKYLEVGLVFGKSPNLYLATGNPRDKKREAEMEQRGVLPRDDFALRVFTPATDVVKKQVKYYVAAKSTNGNFQPRVVRAEMVFFYPEFWRGIDNIPTIRDRLTAVNKVCREVACSKKQGDPGASVLVVPDDTNKTRFQHPSKTTTSDNVASLVLMLHTMYLETGDVNYLVMIKETLKKHNGMNQFGPQTRTEGIYAFLDFGETLTDDLALEMVEELRETWPRGAGKSGLSYSGKLPLLLHLLNGDKICEEAIKVALLATELHGDRLPQTYLPPMTEEDKDKKPLTLQSMRHVLRCLTYVHGQIKDYADRATAEVVDQYGGALPHRSFSDLMARISSAKDKKEAEGLYSELMALHVAACVDTNQQVSKSLGEVTRFITDILGRTKE